MTDDLNAISDKVINYYRENAQSRFEYFEQSFADHCRYAMRFMTPAPGRILDAGCGSGRDAAFFASQGYHVTAVDPATELLALAAQKHAHPKIEWIEDRLPGLEKISGPYNHIHLSAVIFHLPLSETKAVLRTCHRLLKDCGTLFVGLRIGPSDPKRPMFNVSKEWVTEQGQGLFTLLDWEYSEDDYKRADVEWHRVMLKKIS